MTLLRAAALDAVLVLVFVVVGRRAHADGLSVTGVLGVAWPFWTGLALGWTLARTGTARLWSLRAGAVVWAGTLVGGLVLRAVSGGGTAPSFAVVAALALGLLLLGWRLVAHLAARRPVRAGGRPDAGRLGQV